MLIGAQIIGNIVNRFAREDADNLLAAHDWQTIWLIPCIMAAVVAVGFLLLFKNNAKPNEPNPDQ